MEAKMIKNLLLIFTYISLVTCSQKLKNNTTSITRNNHNDTAEVKNLNLQFNFSAAYMMNIKGTIEIKATLFNKRKDTVYFLTSTCDGDQYSLIYDTLIFRMTPFLHCNTSYPKLNKIAPDGRYDFKAHFVANEGTIQLGFDFFQVDRSIDLTKIKLSDIHNRRADVQNIIWGKNKIIK